MTHLHDTHFHLDLSSNPSEVVKRIDENHIYTIAVTNLPALFENTQTLCQNSRFVRPALGYHPELVAQYPSQMWKFESLIHRTRYIGEVGLDKLGKSLMDYQKQRSTFEKILNLCASSNNKIISVHSRRCEKDVIDIIGNNYPGKIILHWFGGSIKQMELAAKQGFYFSINISMTRSEIGRKLISGFPADRILLETDGPFTKIFDSPCEPSHTTLISDKIYSIRGDSNINLTNNFKNLLL